MRGTRANLAIRQGSAEGYRPVLYIEPAPDTDAAAFSGALEQALPRVRTTYPGVGVERAGTGWKVTVPDAYHVGHEAHFGQVAGQFLDYVARGALPGWEVPNMLAKYYTTTQALALAKRS